MYHLSRPSWIGFRPRHVISARLRAMQVMRQLVLSIKAMCTLDHGAQWNTYVHSVWKKRVESVEHATGASRTVSEIAVCRL